MKISSVTVESIDLCGARVDGRCEISDSTIKRSVDLVGGEFSELALCNMKIDGTVNVNGFRFARIACGDSTIGIKKVLDLVEGSPFQASEYRALENYCRESGNESMGDDVYRARRQREGKNLRASEDWPRWILNRVIEGATGYGRNTERLLIPAIVVILLGCFVFRIPYMACERVGDPRWYCSLLYSVDLFVPVIDLGFAREWRPKSECRKVDCYRAIHRVAGWILVPTAIGSLAGLLN